MLRIEPFHVSFSETMRISSDAEEVIFQDVTVGEVWLTGRQSNMEFHTPKSTGEVLISILESIFSPKSWILRK